MILWCEVDVCVFFFDKFGIGFEFLDKEGKLGGEFVIFVVLGVGVGVFKLVFELDCDGECEFGEGDGGGLEEEVFIEEFDYLIINVILVDMCVKVRFRCFVVDGKVEGFEC